MYRSRYRREPNVTAWILGALALILVLGVVFASCSSYYKDSQVKITVTGKESVNTGDGHEYRVYTKDETYVMKDSLLKGRFRTSNDYGALQSGHTYICTKFGWRVPLFSMFQNLRDCKPVAS